MDRDELDKIGTQIVEACFEVHKELGPGLLESAYVAALLTELGFRGIGAEVKVRIPLFYKGQDTGKYYEADLLIEEEIIIEAKAVETMIPLSQAQLLSHLRLTNKKLGYLVNFNVILMKDGIKRMRNGY